MRQFTFAASATNIVNASSRRAPNFRQPGDLLQRVRDEFLAFKTGVYAHHQHEVSQIELMRGLAEADQRVAESRAREGQLEQASRNRRLADFIRD